MICSLTIFIAPTIEAIEVYKHQLSMHLKADKFQGQYICAYGEICHKQFYGQYMPNLYSPSINKCLAKTSSFLNIPAVQLA